MPEGLITKKALGESLKELMNTVPLSKITVGDICDKCGMSRKGFYYHFKDKYDLVNWIFDSEFMLRLNVRDYTNVWQFLSDICEYFYANRKFYINALHIEGQNSFSDHFAEVITPLCMDYISRSFRPDVDSEFYAGFFTDSFRFAIIKWLREESQLDPEKFVELLRGAIAGIAVKVSSDREFAEGQPLLYKKKDSFGLIDRDELQK